MALNTNKDQPPAYTSLDDQSSITGSSAERSTTSTNTARNTLRSARASELSRLTSEGRFTTTQYLEFTFSVMVNHSRIAKPFVLAIDEDYKTLLKNFQDLYDYKKIDSISVVWGVGKPPCVKDRIPLTSENITAMLRLLKSRGGVDTIDVLASSPW